MRTGALLLAAVTFAGCGRNEIQVYRVAKEPAAQAQTDTGMPPGHPETSRGSMGSPASTGLPKLTYKAPPGFEEVTPGEMRIASFRVKGADNKQADVGVFPLPGMAGGDLNNVNRWRSQVGL